MAVRMLHEAVEEFGNGSRAVRHVPFRPLLCRAVRDELYEAAMSVLGRWLDYPLHQAEEVNLVRGQGCPGLRVVPRLPLAMLLDVVHDAPELPERDAAQLGLGDLAASGAVPQVVDGDPSVGDVVHRTVDVRAGREEGAATAVRIAAIQRGQEELLGRLQGSGNLLDDGHLHGAHLPLLRRLGLGLGRLARRLLRRPLRGRQSRRRGFGHIRRRRSLLLRRLGRFGRGGRLASRLFRRRNHRRGSILLRSRVQGLGRYGQENGRAQK
mmetsp:Transcript_36116/g.104005  ORF Transcript_36116/g.104005 Transcript_36116/m.104005 type:complete len:267 (+) Transcript_36116:480-1280(+)